MTPQQQIEAFVEALEPAIRKAFLDAIADIKSEAQLYVVIGHLEAGNVDLALDALNLRAEFFQGFDDALRAAYLQGGTDALSMLPKLLSPSGGRAVLRFGGRNERAETYLRDHSSTLIQEIVEDQRSGVRTALAQGMEAGENPRQVALSVVGRVNKQTGKREGGLVGLHSQQMQWVSNFRSKLAAGDEDYLRMIIGEDSKKPRGHRSIKALAKKALKEGRGLTRTELATAERYYTNRLLKYRGDVIARTEALTSFSNAQFEAMQQQIDNGTLEARDIEVVWLAADDIRTRDSHNGLDDQVVPFGRHFVSPVTGVRLRYPHDTAAIGSVRNVASEVIQCRCSAYYRVDFAKQLARQRNA